MAEPLGDRRRPPLLLLVPGLSGAALLVLPLVALLAKAPWSDLVDRLSGPEVGQALRLSLGCSLTATALCLVLGVPLAWLLAREAMPGTRLLRALVTVPLVLPPVVGGVALLLLLGRRGLVGRPLLEAFGVTVPFTTAAVVLAQAFVSLPFLVLAVEGALRAGDRRLDAAAASLGAGPWTTFRLVTLPVARPGIVAGAALCLARSLGEFGATVTFAGSLPGVTRTMPVEVYLALERDPATAVALSLLLLLACSAVLVALRGRWVPVPR